MEDILIFICVLRKYVSMPRAQALTLFDMSSKKWHFGKYKLLFRANGVQIPMYIHKSLAKVVVSLYEVDIKESTKA